MDNLIAEAVMREQESRMRMPVTRHRAEWHARHDVERLEARLEEARLRATLHAADIVAATHAF